MLIRARVNTVAVLRMTGRAEVLIDRAVRRRASLSGDAEFSWAGPRNVLQIGGDRVNVRAAGQ
jgi:hypothetical protein